MAGRTIRCTIVGTAADDVLVGTDGDDVICGQAGDDVISGGAGDDVLDGGPGNDTVSYLTSPGAVDVRLGRHATGDGQDTLAGLENAIGSSHDDRLFGTPERNSLRGGRGKDVIDARDGDPYDVLDGGAETDLCIRDPADIAKECKHPRDVSHNREVPVLMYHVIGNPRHETPFQQLWVSPRDLARQMRYLDRHGYQVVSLQDVYDYWHGGPLPRRPVVVSFDDGFSNQYTRALPILRRFGWPGTLNLALSHYGQPGGLTRRMITALIRSGWEIDCHSATHPDLTTVSARTLAREVGGARRVMRATFHVPVRFFAYPSGAYDSAVIAAVRRAGFEGATTTSYGLARPTAPFTLARIGILRSDGVHGLATKLAAARS